MTECVKTIDDFLRNEVPDDGFTVTELYEAYFGLVHRQDSFCYVVTREGKLQAVFSEQLAERIG